MKKFLEIVTDDLIRRYTLAGLERCTLVFPMQRAGLFVKQYLSHVVEQSGSKVPIVLPHFTTIDSLADSLCYLQAEEEITSVCTLYQIYKNRTQHQLPIDAFYGWGVQLLNDFSSADMALVDSAHLMQFTSTARLYEQDDLNEETRRRLEKLIQPSGMHNSVQAYFTELWAQLPMIYADFAEHQSQAGVGTRGARTRWTVEHFTEPSIQQRIAGRTYIFIGFNYLLPAEAQLMDLFKAQNQALFYWDNDPNFHLDDTVYRFIRQNIHHFGDSLSIGDSPLSTNITAIACQSSSAQAQYVHDWLMSHHHKGERSAVVIADESLLQSVVYALPSQNEMDARINITKGYPLRSTILFAYVSNQLDQYINTDMSMDQLLPTVIRELESYYGQIAKPEEDTWQRILLDESFYQIQVVLRQIQLLITQNTFVMSQLDTLRVLSNLVRRKLEMVTIPFHGEPITDIQIIGVLETRLLDFDHVLILNVEEGVVPSLQSDHSFLPYDLRREYGMATREEESRIYAYNFFRLMRRAEDVTLLFSDSFTDQGKRTMSRFLMQMLCSPDYTITRQRLSESASVTPYQWQHTCFGDHANDQRPDHLSPSSISTYIECPRYFYLQSIQQLSDSAIEQVMLPPDAIGSLFHAVMQQFYLMLCGNKTDDRGQLIQPVRIEKETIQAYLKQPEWLSEALDKAYVEVNEKFAKYHPESEITTPYLRASHEAENHAIIQLATKALKRDMEQAPFTLVWLEHWVSATIHGMNIQGVIDRLDIIGEGKEAYIRVLDYKTSAYSDNRVKFSYEDLFSNPDKKYALQTLIYSELVSRCLPSNMDRNLPIRPELMFIKQLSKTGNLKDASTNALVLNYQKDSQSSFMPGLEELVQRIADNCQAGQEFVMQPDEKICGKSYCPFHLLCGREKKGF